jgi:hypothetical protein
LWRAPFPKELLCVQSRAYRRVHVPSSMGHQARLAAPGVFQDARVLDLAEEGAGLQVAEPGVEQAMSKGGILTLDGLELRVPNIRVVHQLQRGDGQTRLGVALHGMLEADRRALRRWLNAAEVTSLARS